MTNKVETQGKTVDEAVSEALLRMGARKDEVEVTVLEEPKSGFLGILGGRMARVVVRKRAANRGRRNRDYRVQEEDYRPHDLSGENKGGSRGGRPRNQSEKAPQGDEERQARSGSRRGSRGGRRRGKPADKGSERQPAARNANTKEAGPAQRAERGNEQNEGAPRGENKGGRRSSRGRGRSRSSEGRQEVRQDSGRDRNREPRQESRPEPRQEPRREPRREARREQRPEEGRPAPRREDQRGERRSRSRRAREEHPAAETQAQQPAPQLEQQPAPPVEQQPAPQLEPQSAPQFEPQPAPPAVEVPDEIVSEGIRGTSYAKSLRDVPEEKMDETLGDIANGVFLRAGFPCRCEVKPGEYRQVRIVTDDASAGMLIGRHGSTVDAVEHIIERMAGMAAGDRVRMNLDINNYRRRREEALLERVAEAVARVRETERDYHMEPMCARERRIIHLESEKAEGIRTYTLMGSGGKHVVLGLEKNAPAEKETERNEDREMQPEEPADVSADAVVEMDLVETDAGEEQEKREDTPES